MRINIFYGYSYLLQGENYIESRPTNKIFLQSVRKQTETDRKQKSGILDMSIPDTPEKVNNNPFRVLYLQVYNSKNTPKISHRGWGSLHYIPFPPSFLHFLQIDISYICNNQIYTSSLHNHRCFSE